MVIDFVQFLANLILGLFLLRFVQLKLSPTSDFAKALGYLVH
jgi:hypothetical protein